MRFRSLLVVALLAPTAVWAQDGVPLTKALEMAADEQITDVQEFWYNPDSQLTGVEGFGAGGDWHTLVLGADGKIVRSGADANTTPAISLGEAAEAAMGDGIARLHGVYLRDGKWIVQGWTDSDESRTVVVDGTSGEVE